MYDDFAEHTLSTKKYRDSIMSNYYSCNNKCFFLKKSNSTAIKALLFILWKINYFLLRSVSIPLYHFMNYSIWTFHSKDITSFTMLHSCPSHRSVRRSAIRDCVSPSEGLNYYTTLNTGSLACIRSEFTHAYT